MPAPADDSLPAALPLDQGEAGQTARTSHAGPGIAFMVLSIALFSVMDALIKWLGGRYPTMEIVFFRSLFAFVPLSFFVFRRGLVEALRINDWKGHLFRAVIGIVAMTTFFYCFARMPLADVVAISFAAPVFVTALAVPLLGETVGARRWTAVLVGFAGVLIMVQPGTGVFDPMAALVLFGTLFYAVAMILIRKPARIETSTAIVFFYTAASTLLAAAFLPFQWVTPDWADLGLLISVGLVGGLAQITMTQAFRYADVAVIMPFEYTAMIWAALFGYFIWGELPGLNIWIGVAIVAAAGLYIVHREANLRLRRGTARKLQARR